VRINAVWIDGSAYHNFDAEALTVRLPEGHGDIKVRVCLTAAESKFVADLVRVHDGVAHIALAGDLGPDGIPFLEEHLNLAVSRGAKELVLDLSQLDSISSEALRYIIFTKQKMGADFELSITGANQQVQESIEASNLIEAVAIE
jgi:anti-anti-sigma factor